jgi:protocatechuate 3,4-dioxygenase, beta subunit
MKNVFFWLSAVCLTCSGCTTPTKPSDTRVGIATPVTSKVGGACDGCELMFTGIPDSIGAVSKSKGSGAAAISLTLTGTIFEADGKTPASGVILYYWHTDETGVYASREDSDPQAKAHGYLRGWIKTDSTGHYIIHTIRPAPYVNDVIPAHIHLLVKEPAIADPYYMDLYFDDDPLLIPHYKKYKAENRGGSERLRVLNTGNGQLAIHNIVLGLHIPNYPHSKLQQNNSGLHIGEDQPSFMPFHAWGPDKGSKACPVCKYGRFHGILLFTGAQTNWEDVKKWLVFLEAESSKRKDKLKVYFVYGNEMDYAPEKRRNELEMLGRELKLSYVALTFVPSFNDTASEINLSRINPEVQNTLLIYRHRVIIDKYVNIAAGAENFERISKLLDDTAGSYFNLREPEFD